MALYRFPIKSPDFARDLFDDWNETMGKKLDMLDYLDCGEYFTIELDTKTNRFSLVKMRGRARRR